MNQPHTHGFRGGVPVDGVTTRQLLDISCLADTVGQRRATELLRRFTGRYETGASVRALTRRQADAFILALRVLAAEGRRKQQSRTWVAPVA